MAHFKNKIVAEQLKTCVSFRVNRDTGVLLFGVLGAIASSE